MVRKGDWKLIIDSYGSGELYNLEKDPSELENLFYARKYRDVRDDLMIELLTWELRLQDPLPVPSRRYHFRTNEYNYHFNE